MMNTTPNSVNKLGQSIQTVAMRAILLWTMIAGLSLAWNVHREQQQTLALVTNAARASFNKDNAFRFWAVSHGGVYVPSTARTPPNPNLRYIPERDIKTPSGKKLTLMNPAYMVRQIMEEYPGIYGIRGRITSLKPLNQNNAPDAWEKAALLDFDRGDVDEVMSITEQNGERSLRLIRPMLTKKGCLKCHGHQGYQVGDIRGGIGVIVPMAPYLVLEQEAIITMVWSHAVLWLLGVGGIGFFLRWQRQRQAERQQAEEALHTFHQKLQASEKQFRAILDNTPSVVFLKDLQGRYLLINPRFEQLFHLSNQETQGATDFDLFPAAYAKIFQDHDRNVAQSGKPLEFEEVLPHDDGLHTYISVKYPLYDANKTMYGVCGIATDITERKRSEQALKKSEESLSKAQAMAHLGNWDWDIVTNRLDWSDEIYRICALNPQGVTLTKDRFLDLVHPDDRQAVQEAVQLSLTDETRIFEMEHRIVRADGSERVVIENGEVIRNHAGEPIRMVGTVQDITERKRVEDKLKKSESKYRLLMENATDAILVANVETGMIVDANKQAAKLLGYSVSEMIGLHQTQIYPAAEKQKYHALFQKAVVKTQGDIQEISLVHRAGHTIPVEVQSGLMDLGDQRVIHGIFRDIRDRKEADEKNRIAFESRAIINQLLETALEPMSLHQQLETILDIIFSTSWFNILPKGAIFLTDSTTQELVLTVHRGFSPELVSACHRIAVGQCLCGRALQSKELLFSDCVDDRHDIYLEGTAPHGHYIVPIMAQGHCYGVINLYLTENHLRNIEEEAFLDSLAQTVVGLIERRNIEGQLKVQAEFDKLTGLPNRALFQIRLSQHIGMASRSGQEVVVMFLDLDRFKQVNDTLGHEAGDKLLHAASERILACVRQYDTVSRMGGDEFTIIMPQLTHVCYVEFVARRILEELNKPFELPQGVASISCSIGIAIYPHDGEELADLLKNADTAMYHAKESGRKTFSFFTSQMQDKAVKRLAMEKELRAALEQNNFELHYQPKQNLHTGQISSMEALLRWNKPGVGVIPPNEFISLAEEVGLIVPLGGWVLRNACQQNKIWQDQGYAPMRVAVNLSPRQFNQPADLISTILSALQESGLKSEYLELEITESMVMDNVEEAIQTMAELQAMNIQISVDDFGTGHSSLGSLKKFPITALKIDRSFVQDLTPGSDDAAIVLSILSMAKQLNLKTVAEGVETSEQMAFLQHHGCDAVQGYYLSKPLPVEDFTTFLDQRG